MFEVVVVAALGLLLWQSFGSFFKPRPKKRTGSVLNTLQSVGSNVREVESSGIGLESVDEYADAQTWEDNSTIMLFATRGSGIDLRVWRAHDRLIFPMNQKRVKFDVRGKEVGEAYNELVNTAITHPMCAGWPWILTYEEDNGPEPEAFQKLLAAIRHCPDCKEPIGNEQYCSQGHRGYDGIAGLYWTKVRPSSPMAFGDPSKPRDFSTQDVSRYVPRPDDETGGVIPADPLDQIIEVNAIPMGFTLYRRSLFEQLERPWFVTADPELNYAGENRGAIGQDIFLCLKAKELVGARFGVHCGVKVAHYDAKTGRTW